MKRQFDPSKLPQRRIGLKHRPRIGSIFIPTIVFSLLASLMVMSCDKEPPVVEKNVPNNQRLAEHSSEFKKGIVEVTDGVYVAIGYGLANSILIEGDDGVVIVDVMESSEAAGPVKEAFEKITTKPVKALIYTHNHTDHIFGSRIMAGGDKPDVYAHESTQYYIDRIVNVIREIIFVRSMRQFGTFLPPEDVINAGIGPELIFNTSTTPMLIRPNKTFSKDMSFEIAGIKIELVHAPGETNDQIFVWLPDKKVLLPGDNFYKAFPNLYAIRGTSYRDVMDWAKSLDKIRTKRAEYLVPSHTRPLMGADFIHKTLTDYRDAIQYVHDQTVRGINQGLTPDQLVETVKLPKHLAESPFLQEYYGTVEWSVRSIFSGYLGWFSGNPTELSRLPIKERAQKFVGLAGGEDALLKQTRQAVTAGDHKWALELADQLLILDPESEEVKELKAISLAALGRQHISANGRHYYLSQAMELRGQIDIVGAKTTSSKEMVHSIPLISIFTSMAVRLNPEKSVDVDTRVNFRFPDTDETISVHIRNGIADIQSHLLENPDITVTVSSTVWKEIVSGLANPAVAYAKRKIRVDGGTIALIRFLGLFGD
ncbi:MAG: MBL fold metallo-hydrolase [Proteobacteria bacterium]|nr:MBL fold metallo-hydrolase [Pseudomonadota bacterium]